MQFSVQSAANSPVAGVHSVSIMFNRTPVCSLSMGRLTAELIAIDQLCADWHVQIFPLCLDCNNLSWLGHVCRKPCCHGNTFSMSSATTLVQICPQSSQHHWSSQVIWDHTVLPATRQKRRSRHNTNVSW